MLLVEENHAHASTSTHANSKMLYMEKDMLVVVEDEAIRHEIEAADVSKEEGIVVMPIAIADPLEARGVKAAHRYGKRNPMRNSGIVARTVTRRESARKSALNNEIGSNRTIPNDPKKSKRGQPS